MYRNLAAICGAKVSHSTSSHLQCNGKVERVHRTLKAAIKAHDTLKWTSVLPTILLGLRSALRSDTNHSIAQMVYGTNIKIPGEFFDEPSIKIDADNFASKLQHYMDLLKPLKANRSVTHKSFVHKDLKSCSHVFVRIDRVKRTLEKP